MVSADEKERPEWYAQVHAWRALGQLGAGEAISAMLGILHQIDVDQDDWLSSDAPGVFELLGPPAIEPLAAYLADEDNAMYARCAASSSLARIAAAHPQARERCIQAIAAVLEDYEENDEGPGRAEDGSAGGFPGDQLRGVLFVHDRPTHMVRLDIEAINPGSRVGGESI